MHKGYEILVVDDSSESLQLLTTILMEQGYKVRPARDPNLALESAFSKPPDLVLLDVKMPNMDGFEVCQKLKENEGTASIPVIFISALQEIRDRVRGFEVGGVDFITKPIQREEVLVRVNVHLTIHYLQVQLKEANTELEKTVAERTKALLDANKALTESLKEKDALLREVYHRTKNNMQVVCSILHLQSESEEDERLASLLTEAENRVMSMGLIHEMLYKSKSLTQINLAEFIKDFISHLDITYVPDDKKVSYTFNLTDVPINIDSAVPCGLILNELLTNVFKHAFPEDDFGKISITLNMDIDKNVICVITDNGIGLPDGFDLKKINTFGLTIASDIVEKQLLGKIELVDSEGAGFKFSFKEREYKKRI